MIGASNIFLFIPVVPELIRELSNKYPQYSEEVNADISSTLYSCAYALGSLIGPFLGGILVKILTFPRGAGLLGLSIIGLSIYFMLTSNIWENTSSGSSNQKAIEMKAMEAPLMKGQAQDA